MDKLDEEVLVIPTKYFRRFYFQGVRGLVESNLRNGLLQHDRTCYLSRREVEDDPGFKQVIPYTVLIDRNTMNIFSYVRGDQSGEKRLRSKKSIGIGGHVRYPGPFDSRAEAVSQVVLDSVARELQEEVNVSLRYDSQVSYTLRSLLLNDDRDDVGKVHLGFVDFLKVNPDRVRSREPEILQVKSESLLELLQQYDQLEGWSQLILRGLRWDADDAKYSFQDVEI